MKLIVKAGSRTHSRPRSREAFAAFLAVILTLVLGSHPTAARADPLSDRIGALVQDAAGERAIARDAGTLDAVAAWAAREAFSGRQDRAALRERLWAAGVRDFEFRPLTVVARGVDPALALKAALADPKIRWSRFTHYALSVVQGDERTAACVLLTRRAARFAEVGQQGRLGFQLLDGVGQPALFVTRPDGSVERFDAFPVEEAWGVEWDPGSLSGDLLLELVADGATGPEVLALWPEEVVDPRRRAPSDSPAPGANNPFPEQGPIAWDPYHDRPAPERGEGSWLVGVGEGPERPPSSVDAKNAEDHLWRLIQNERTARGLDRLTRDSTMTKAARQHAGELVRGEPFGHHTSSGNALDRLTTHGFAASRATENVAVAAHVAEAHSALMASPAHRANLLDEGTDHGAVGVVLQRDARGRWSATASEVFALALPDGGVERWGDLALDAINDVRSRQNLDPLRTRDRLTALVQTAADTILASGVLEFPLADRNELVEQVRFNFNGVGRVSVDLVVTTQPARAGKLAHVLEAAFDEVGIGVVTLTEGLGGHSEGTPLLLLVFLER
jgi:uncharacterized protein YkwD